MRAVDIGIGHDDDFVVAQFLDIEFVAANARAQRHNQRADLIGGQHFVKARPFDIQNLAAQRQNRLIFTRPALLGRSARRITLHDEELGFGRVFFLTIGEFPRQGADVQRRLAPRQIAGFASRFARRSGLDDFHHDLLGFFGMLFKPFGQFLCHQTFDHGTNLGRDQLVFGLGREFRVRHFDRQNTGQPLTRIIARDRDFLFLRNAAFGRVFVDHTGERATKACQMGATIALGDVVGKAEDILVIAVIPLHRGFDRDAVFLGDGIDRLGDLRGTGAIEVLDKGFHPALIFEHNLPRLGFTQIAEQDFHAGIQEGQLAQPVFKRFAVIFDHCECAVGGEKAHGGAGIDAFAVFALGAVALFDQGRFGVSAIDKAAIMLFAVAVDGKVEPVRQSVHNRDADPVQATRDFVGIGVEFSARVQLGHDHFGC